MKLLKPPGASEVFDTYWLFAYERQAIYWRRLAGCPQPWTQNEILRVGRFTNPYRAADRVSQYLIRYVIYANGDYSPEDTVFRVLLFKVFNRIETWQWLERAEGRITWTSFEVDNYARHLDDAMAAGLKIYSPAYIMPPVARFGFTRKHRDHLSLLDHMLRDGLSRRVARARSLNEVYRLLVSYPGIGPFLGLQYAVDLNYSELIDFSEMDFIVPGPGAIRGIRKCFPSWDGKDAAALIRLCCEAQHREFAKRQLNFQSLWGRDLQLIDCQNLFCEIDKYSRVAFPNLRVSGGGSRIKQRFRPNAPLTKPWFPPKWRINSAVDAWFNGANHVLV